jgi:hypothetical protein
LGLGSPSAAGSQPQTAVIHAETNIEVIHEFPDVPIEVAEEEDGTLRVLVG